MSDLTGKEADVGAAASVRVDFWAKAGCITNTRQIRMLEAAGCGVAVRDLLREPWTPERLGSFFTEIPVPEWFNRAAPAVKSGEVVPERFGAAEALARMVAEPLLIRRPLIRIGGACRAGFNAAWLAAQGVHLPAQDALPEGCAHGAGEHAPCPEPSVALSGSASAGSAPAGAAPELATQAAAAHPAAAAAGIATTESRR